MIFVILKFKRVHLKFTVYSGKHTYTHVCNTVMLLWGLLKLALTREINMYNYTREINMYHYTRQINMYHYIREINTYH